MIKNNYVLLATLATFLISVPSFANAKRKVQFDVLDLDATLSLVAFSATAGISDVAKKQSNVALKEAGENAAGGAGYNLFGGHTRAADLVSKVYDSVIPFGGGSSGLMEARKAAESVFGGYPVELLRKTAFDVAENSIAQGRSAEEAAKAATKAVFTLVISRAVQIREVIQWKVWSKGLNNEFDAAEVLKVLKAPIETDSFAKVLPEIQEYYKTKVSQLEQEIKD